MCAVLPRATRLFLAGRWTSAAGDWLGTMALGWVLVRELDGGSSSYAWSRLLGAAGAMVISLFAGSLLYRFSGPSLLMFACTVAASMSLVVAGLVYHIPQDAQSRTEILRLLLIASFFGGCVAAFRDAGEQRVQATIVPRGGQDRLESVWTKLHYLGRISFGLLSGVVLAVAGTPLLFVLDATTFIILGACTLITLRIAPSIGHLPLKEETVARHPLAALFSGIAYGFRSYIKALLYVRTRPDLILLFWILFVLEGIGFTAWNFLPEIVAKDLKQGGFAFGVVVCLAGVGGLIGVLIKDYVLHRYSQWGAHFVFAGTWLAPLGLLLASLCPNFVLFGCCYGIALLGWAWFLPPIRVFCRMDLHAPLACSVLSLFLLGLAKVAQVGMVVLLSGVFKLTATMSLQVSALSCFVLLVLTFVIFRNALRRTLSLLCAKHPDS